MEGNGQSGIPTPGAGFVSEVPGAKRILTRPQPLRARDVQLYRACEELTEPLIYFMAVFSPWAFGTTQPRSIWLMNAVGYILGLLLACKLVIRWFKGYHPPRWERVKSEGLRDIAVGQWSLVLGLQSIAARLIAVLAVLTVAILGYCLLSAVNARATFHLAERSFAYHRCILWLPHSLDSSRTWVAFWTYLGLACSFWAIRDWLMGKSEGEARAERRNPQTGGEKSGPLLPVRLCRLLWILAINGGLLGAEGIIQRLDGSGKLLFLVKPRVNPGASTQFGPYAYRANASQYFNLIWPVCLGFWWTLNRSHSTRRGAHHLLLFIAAIMAACPIISTSRGGALVTVAIIALASFFLLSTHFLLTARRQGDRPTQRVTLACLVLFFSSALALGFTLGWKTLKPRLHHMSEDAQIRWKMYEKARPMAGDYPLFGTGPGTFETVFPLYRFSTGTYWPAQLHNDWLEIRITFGWLGSALIALALMAVLLRWFAPGGIHGGKCFIVLTWLALSGCMVHARYDFPFQIYSIVLLFLVLCAILSNITRRTL